MTLHPSVTLAEGVTVPPEAWIQHGNVLMGGIANHQVIIRGFSLHGDGTLSIRMDIYPADQPKPLRFRES